MMPTSCLPSAGTLTGQAGLAEESTGRAGVVSSADQPALHMAPPSGSGLSHEGRLPEIRPGAPSHRRSFPVKHPLEFTQGTTQMGGLTTEDLSAPQPGLKCLGRKLHCPRLTHDPSCRGNLGGRWRGKTGGSFFPRLFGRCHSTAKMTESCSSQHIPDLSREPLSLFLTHSCPGIAPRRAAVLERSPSPALRSQHYSSSGRESGLALEPL